MNQAPSCPACKDAASNFYTSKGEHDVFRCSACKTLFVHPLPKTTADIYGKEYFAGGEACGGYADYDRDKQAMTGAFINFLKRLEQELGRPGKLLDVGTATGFFLELARQRGWEVWGVEISNYAAEIARKKGLRVETGTVFSPAYPSASFDIITLWDVIEHVPNTAETLQEIRRLLNPKGVLALITPDASSLWARCMGSRWHLLNPPEHLACYTRQGMRALLEASSFEAFFFAGTEKSFSLPYILRIASHWLGWQWLDTLGGVLENSIFARFAIPLNFHDNMFVLSKYRHE